MSSTSSDSKLDVVVSRKTVGDLAGWTQESRRVYLELSDKLLPQGWHISDTSVNDSERLNFAYCDSNPDSMFTWVSFIQRAEMKSVHLWQFGSRVRSNPSTIHGGIVSMAFDHVLAGQIHRGLDVSTVTANLVVNYITPVPVNTPVIIEGKIDRIDGRKYFTSGTMKSPDGKTIYCKSTALFVELRTSEKNMHKFKL